MKLPPLAQPQQGGLGFGRLEPEGMGAQGSSPPTLSIVVRFLGSRSVKETLSPVHVGTSVLSQPQSSLRSNKGPCDQAGYLLAGEWADRFNSAGVTLSWEV